MKKIALLLADGFEEVEAITPADFLRRAGVEVILCGVYGPSVTGSHDITIEADLTLDELPDDLDGVVIPGGMPGAANIAESEEALKLIKRIHNDSELVGAICAAPAVVLGSAGILEGREFTCYPGFEKEVSGARFSEARVVRDSNLITSRGPGTAAEFSLALVEYLVSKEKAKELALATLQGSCL
ncbi:MAG: DJ-1/PfpI family protein [Spirochaetales bacterium]|nr:DJ-1/PfpI family protein [Spirochaetales bacterium]